VAKKNFHDETMKTNLLYMTDSYQKTATAKIVDIKMEGPKQAAIILDQTIFYAQGGGQPADQGSINGENGSLAVSHVSYNGGEVQHKGKIVGELQVGETVTLELNWKLRYHHMQLHTAGHIVDQAVKNVVPEAHSIDGNHGISKKLYIEFDTKVDTHLAKEIQAAANEIISAHLLITTEMVTREVLELRGVKTPADLPANKQLRIVQIGKYDAMPDGGTQLKNTSECWPISITGIEAQDGKWQVHYSVQDMATDSPIKIKKQVEKIDRSSLGAPSEQLVALEEQINQLKTQIAAEKGADLQTKYLGKKGSFNQIASVLRELPSQEKKYAGQLLNELKTYLEETVAAKLSAAKSGEQKWVDLTLPGIQPAVGHMHPVSQAMEEITRIFEQVGFTRVRYPEVDWDHYVFEALNMPPNHPARDEWETFFIDAPIDKKFGKVVLTTHTSNGQVREMERLNSQPPIRMVNIGRCYRRQQDATHTQMFHQFEGLVVDKGINIQHLKGTLDYFAQQFYGPGTKSRIRPFHFQFTEPSFEVDFSCHICHGTGKVEVNGESVKCKFCKSGWHEVGGAGMVHPNVLKAGGLDPDQYTGFAFGWGIERTYTLKQGLNIDDIRLIYSGDLRFLEQF
jgi:phenylalanyl-tRNA synthetase alpha chain